MFSACPRPARRNKRLFSPTPSRPDILPGTYRKPASGGGGRSSEKAGESPDPPGAVPAFSAARLPRRAGGTLYGGLLPELCVSCAYGFAFLLLSTSYLGFLLIPAVFGIKGFLSACTAAAFLNSGCDHAFWLSCVAVGLPGIFLVPALFLLGTLCAQMSVRLLEQRRGLPVPVSSERYSRELALVFCLLLAAAAAACYAVPFFTRLIL